MVESLKCMTHGEFTVSIFLVLVVLPTGVTSQGWRPRKLMLLFLNSRTKIESENML
jgi:hypothetical protein